MAKVLVLYHSTYGHIETMAYAVAEGAKAEGADVTVMRVPELVPDEVAKASHYKMDQAAPVAKVDDLLEYDAIIVGAGTRFGTVASQMRNFWDQTGGLWFQGKLIGKVGSVFTSTATQHGGPGIDDPLLHPDLPAPWHGRRRSALFVPGPDGHRGSQGRLPVWRLHDHEW